MTSSMRRWIPPLVIAFALPCSLRRDATAAGVEPVYFDVPRGAHPHDVAAVLGP